MAILNLDLPNSIFTQIFSIGLLLFLLTWTYYCFRSIYSFWTYCKIICKIPGPKRHPLWGTLHKFQPNEEGIVGIHNYILDHPDERIMLASVGPFIHFVRLFYPEEIEQLLCMKHNILPKNKMLYGILKQFIGDGLLTSNFDKWQYRRKLLTPGFHYDVLIPYVSVFNDSVEVFIDKCDRQIKDGKDWIGIFETVTLLTLDNMLKCVCSYESHCQCMQEDDEYVSALKDNTELAKLQVFYFPYLIKPIFYLSPDGARWRKNCKIVQEHALKVIRHRRDHLLSGQGDLTAKPYKDFIDILLTARDGEGNGLTNQDIVEEMTTFIFRGHDTTASGVSWTLYLLAAHPHCQDLCREEIRAILNGRDSERIQWEDLPKLHYLSMCIKESLRLYPPVHDVFRTNVKDINLGGYLIPKGTNIDIGIASIHRNPHIWENPDTFNPLRFDCDSPGGHPFAFIPFSGGQRNCIGQKFAFNEELITIARIINRYNLESLTKSFRRMPGIVYKPEQDIRIKLSQVIY